MDGAEKNSCPHAWTLQCSTKFLLSRHPEPYRQRRAQVQTLAASREVSDLGSSFPQMFQGCILRITQKKGNFLDENCGR